MSLEARSILALWDSALARGEEVAMATVVRVEGSSYRKPGARMLVTQSGQRAGTVSGGCLETEVARKIWWLTEQGPSIHRYAIGFDEDLEARFGLGCGGSVTLLLERGDVIEEVVDLLRASIDQRASGAIVTVIGTNTWTFPIGTRVTLERPQAPRNPALLPLASQVLQTRLSTFSTLMVQDSEVEVFAEYIAPPIGLFVFGAGDDVLPVVNLARQMGWHVSVADSRADRAVPQRFPLADTVAVLDSGDPLRQLRIGSGDAAVILTHSYRQDGALLRALLPLNLPYLGILGPVARTAQLISESAEAIGLPAGECMARTRSPIGLDIGATNSETIALSIISEVQAVLSSRGGGPLRLSQAQSANGG